MVFIDRGGKYAVIMKAHRIFFFKRLVLCRFFKDHFTGLTGIEISKELIDIDVQRLNNIEKNR